MKWVQIKDSLFKKINDLHVQGEEWLMLWVDWGKTIHVATTIYDLLLKNKEVSIKQCILKVILFMLYSSVRVCLYFDYINL